MDDHWKAIQKLTSLVEMMVDARTFSFLGSAFTFTKQDADSLSDDELFRYFEHLKHVYGTDYIWKKKDMLQKYGTLDKIPPTFRGFITYYKPARDGTKRDWQKPWLTLEFFNGLVFPDTPEYVHADKFMQLKYFCQEAIWGSGGNPKFYDYKPEYFYESWWSIVHWQSSDNLIQNLILKSRELTLFICKELEYQLETGEIQPFRAPYIKDPKQNAEFVKQYVVGEFNFLNPYPERLKEQRREIQKIIAAMKGPSAEGDPGSGKMEW